MGIQEYYWDQQELDSTKYAGKYVTHDNVNKRSDKEILMKDQSDLELGTFSLDYNEKVMDVELQIHTNWACFFYDQTFEEELGDRDFNSVITYFLTPEPWKPDSDIHPE
jgi:hypothetical protein